MRVLVPIVAACALVVAAPAAARDPKAPTQRHTAADMRLARSLALRASDLAAGWTKVPAQKPPPPCSIEPNESTLVETGSVDPTFLWKNTVNQIGSEVDVFRTAAQARTHWRLTTLRLMRVCLLESARGSFGKQVTVRVRSARALKAPSYGARSLHYRVVLEATQHPAKGPSRTIVLVSDLVGIGAGRINLVLHTVSIATPLPTAAVAALTKTLAGRLAGRAGGI